LKCIAIVTLHDACPSFASRTFKITTELEKLEIKYNIALVPFFNGEQDLPRFSKFVEEIKYCRAQIALHGLYHETRRRQIDNFGTSTKATAEQEIRAGLHIFQEVGIDPTVFIPPCWQLNINSIKTLVKLKFRLTEIQEKLILIFQRTFKKIPVPKVLNWDSCADPEKNIVNIGRNRRRFELLHKQKIEIIRIALHPRDPFEALEDQKNMISRLKDQGYQFVTYSEIIPKLQKYLVNGHASWSFTAY
jgi:predicted deacetylase